MHNIAITSRGRAAGTHISLDGKKLENVTAICVETALADAGTDAEGWRRTGIVPHRDGRVHVTIELLAKVNYEDDESRDYISPLTQGAA